MIAPVTHPLLPPSSPPRRFALLGPAPDLAAQSWVRCRGCGGEFASECRERGHYQVYRQCQRCGCGELESWPTPYVGTLGWMLEGLLAQVGMVRKECWVGYGEHLDQLKEWRPHLVVAMGPEAFKLLSGLGKLDMWRGSILQWEGTKLIGTYGVERWQREWELREIARLDLKRARAELATDTIEVSSDHIEVQLSKEAILLKLSLIKEKKLKMAVDIEGWVDFISCIGFATGPNEAFVVPFIKEDNTSFWEEEEEVELWVVIAAVLEDNTIPKVLQNYLYDSFVLAWSYGIVIEGLVDDTMVKAFELEPEWEKGLGFLTSIYTKHPAYKFERKSDDDVVRLVYCGKDCCRTFEINEVMELRLKPQQREHYRFNLRMLQPLLYMELRGIKFNYEEAQKELKATWKRIYALQDRINREAAEGRGELRDFYEALEMVGGMVSRELGKVCPGDSSGVCMEEREMVSTSRDGLLPILRQAFCKAESLCKEEREVEEVWWQPMRWNGKKWVKAGKRLDQEAGKAWAESCNACQDQNPAVPYHTYWLKSIRKLVTKRVAVEIKTLEDVRRFAKDSCRADCHQAIQLVKSKSAGDSLTPAQRGELATLLGLSINSGSTNQGGDSQWFLYEHLKLPKQFIKEGGRLTSKLASDDEAVIKGWVTTRDRRAIWFITLRRLLTSTKSLRIETDGDGRVRGSINLVGTKTHRMTYSESPTGKTKVNLQTITKSHRHLYEADDGCWLAQRDLSGADSWTVAELCRMLGDSNLLLDQKAKIKPAQITALMLDRGVGVNGLSREELYPLCSIITEENDWRYQPMKRAGHGWTYLMGDKTTSDQILTDTASTGKPIFMEPRKLGHIRDTCFFKRYPGIPRMHEWIATQLKEKGCLVASNGFKRNFHGRLDDQSTQREAVAHLPQVFTTYATCLATLRLWEDPENRRDMPLDGILLRIEPLLMVHDSLVPQFRKEELEWAREKLREYFDNPIRIVDEPVVIPASGTYGPSWGEQGEKL